MSDFDDPEFISMADLEEQESLKFDDEQPTYVMVDDSSTRGEKRVRLGETKIDEVPAKKRDEFDVYGEYIACKMRSLDKRSYCFAQKKIGDVIFDAEMGKYKEDGGGSSYVNL